MKIDDREWMDWLHEIRAKSERERKRLGLSYSERLARAEETAKKVREELTARNAPVARDRKPDA